MDGPDHEGRPDPDGIMSCIYAEERTTAVRALRCDPGGSLAAAGIASSGTPEQIARWPRVFRRGR